MKNNPLIRSTSTSETLLRLELEKLSSENKRLKRKIEQLTKENMEMKQSLFEFNANRHLLADRINLRIPFDIKQHSKMLDAQLSKQKTLKSIDDEMDSDKLSSNKLSNKLFYYTFEFLVFFVKSTYIIIRVIKVQCIVYNFLNVEDLLQVVHLIKQLLCGK